MKSFTDLEQSKKLAEILPIESADGFYEAQHNPLIDKWEYILFTGNKWASEEVVIPCWSLAALLSVFSTPKLELDEQEDGERGWFVSHYTDDYRYDSYYRDEPIDACYDLILQLKEKDLL